MYASVGSQALDHVCRQQVWSVAQGGNVFWNTKDTFHLKAD